MHLSSTHVRRIVWKILTTSFISRVYDTRDRVSRVVLFCCFKFEDPFIGSEKHSQTSESVFKGFSSGFSHRTFLFFFYSLDNFTLAGFHSENRFQYQVYVDITQQTCDGKLSSKRIEFSVEILWRRFSIPLMISIRQLRYPRVTYWWDSASWNLSWAPVIAKSGRASKSERQKEEYAW